MWLSRDMEGGIPWVLGLGIQTAQGVRAHPTLISAAQQGMKTKQRWSSPTAALLAVGKSTRGFTGAYWWDPSLGSGMQDQGSVSLALLLLC